MKQDSLQQLLAKYQEGTLSDEEREQLNRLTHRDEVLAAAEERAHTIVRRRTRIAGLAVAGTMVLGAGIWMLAPKEQPVLMAAVNEDKDMTIVEEVVETEEIQETPQYTAPVAAKPSEPVLTAAVVNTAKRIEAEEASDEISTPDNIATHPATESEPIVVCNNQCDADSVISDIWKFLSA